MGLAAQREELEKERKQETGSEGGVVTAKRVTRQGWFERKARALLMTEDMVPVWI